MTDPTDALVDRPERAIAFESVFNFRDLGGYPAVGGSMVGWRRLFRADGLHRLGREDGEQFRSLRIATVIDLRTDAEVVERGRFPADLAEVGYHHLPMFDVEPDWSLGDAEAPGFLADRYVDMLAAGRTTVATSLAMLARSASYPLVFHCAAGKDRTGILAAVVLGLLGVPDDVIVEDYAVSHEAMAKMVTWMAANQPGLALDPSRYPSSIIEARPETMARFLAHVRQSHGSIDGLARDLGVEQGAIDAIRDILLEPPG